MTMATVTVEKGWLVTGACVIVVAIATATGLGVWDYNLNSKLGQLAEEAKKPAPAAKIEPTTKPAEEGARYIAKGSGTSVSHGDGESAASRAVANAFAQANSGSAVVDVHTESGPSVELKRVGEIVSTIVGSDKTSDLRVDRKKDGVFTVTITPKERPKPRILDVKIVGDKVTVEDANNPGKPARE